ncbi:MAG: fatty acid kinase fatty acid binding subunit [Solirubrobacteraceae bacterium]|jgi:DegV family protein with EDD domain|nr:fatty acid kinase fatty acid binding subunit [Solirubrobacteraceae bacterium]
MTVAVVTDSTHYLPADVSAAGELHVVPLYVTFGGTLARESDMPDLQDFYERLRAAADDMPTTSQPSIGDFLECYEPLLAAGRDIVSIHLSAGISGTYDSALQASAELAGRGYEGRVKVLDSRTVCGGLGLMLLAAASRARSGAGLEEVAAHALSARDGLRIWFSLDTLEYLRRGGRIGGAQAWLGGALKIKPILSLESTIEPVERVRTAGRTFERMVRYAQQLHDGGADAWCVQHIQAEVQAGRLIDRGREIFGCEPLFVGEVGPVIGAHAGPGMLGIGAMPASMLD